jgi:hypothetical protein
MTTRAEHHAENVRRAKSVDMAIGLFDPPAPKQYVVKGEDGHPLTLRVRSTAAPKYGVQQILIEDSVKPAHEVVAKKDDRATLHPRAKSVADRLSDNGIRLLDHIVRKDEAFGGSRLVDVIVQQIASALDVPEKEAEEARRELERLGLITFYDNFSGDRGYRPKV